MTSPRHLTARLLRALDADYNVIDMHAIDEVISVLENINITKEVLETTRLGKHINELRRRTGDTALARRTKSLLKKWRDLVIPEKSGSKVPNQPTSAETTPLQSPYASRGISPAITPTVTPRLCSPAVLEQGLNFHKQGSSPLLLDTQKRQPLTSPAVHRDFRNTILGQKISPALKNVSAAVRATPDAKNVSLCVISPALRINSEAAWNNVTTPSKDPYDSDSQDVIFVDDNVDDTRTTFSSNSNNVSNFSSIERSSVSKRPRSPVNGGPDTLIPGEELRNDAKRKRRESNSRKAKKRRNHTKSENRTIDHDIAPVDSPFLPISSASTSPALSFRNGLTTTQPNTPIVSLIIDDLDSKSPVPTSEPPKSKSTSGSRKNGCKRPIEVDDYSNFIKNKIPTGGRKVKTTKELLEEMQARKSGKIPPVTPVLEPKKPKEDFLTTYDTQKQLKKEAIVVTDIIELNDSNDSSSKIEDEPKTEVVAPKVENDDKPPAKFESVEVILSRLPPIDYNDKESVFTPHCSCEMVYFDDKTEESKKSIFELEEEPKCEQEKPDGPNYEERLDPECAAHNIRPAEVSSCHVDALHNTYVIDVNGSSCEDANKDPPKLACKTTAWGLRPYYDCSRDLFHSVVPKYNYLDYSLDRCVKNLSNIVLDKYDPVEAISDSEQWYLNLESEHFAKWNAEKESVACDEFESASDLPFCEGEADESPVAPVDSDTKPSDNLDRSDGDDEKKEPSKKTGKPNCFEILDYMVETQCQPFTTTYSKCIFLDDADFTSDIEPKSSEPIVEVKVESPPPRVEPPPPPRPIKKFTYEDKITLLPLSLGALNSLVTYNEEYVVDLSCVFRTKDVECELSYGLVNDTKVLEMKDVPRSRTRNVLVVDDENANLEKPSGGDEQVPSADNEGDRCVGGGCPSWIPGSEPRGVFCEWHEPLVRTSHGSGEPLTVLPYVVID